jgi:hypothetical protein
MCDETKSSSYSNDHWNLEAVSTLVNPKFLLWQSKANPQNVWTSCIDPLDDRIIFLSTKGTKRRREDTRHYVPRIAHTQHGR